MSDPLKAFLTKNNVLTEQQFNQAAQKALTEKVSLMHAIEMLRLLDTAALLKAFSAFYRVPATNLSEKEIPRAITDSIPRELAVKHRVIPIDRVGNNVIVAMANPRNINTINAIRTHAGFAAKPVLATETHIAKALEKYYSGSGGGKSSARPSPPTPPGRKRKNELQFTQGVARVHSNRKEITDKSGDGPVITAVNKMLIECLRRGASDIHLEPYEGFLRCRLRVDGALREIERPDYKMRAALTSRIKIMSNLDIAETRLPQDGAINIQIDGRPVDFRVNTLPTVYGEKIVMRILDKSALKVDMTELGFDQDELDKFKSAIHCPFGMVLVTGPTGSGKTTTLYSALADLNRESENIMTAEDPVEFNLAGINQVGMKPDIGLDFAAALKAFLRQDPDIIMVGEVRDLETAEIAIKAALTGHMVLSTLHTNSAPETISRLLNMGVEAFNLVSALQCITAQRLMKKICGHCRVVDDSVTPEAFVALGVHPKYADRVKAYKGEGCKVCAGTGLKGRIAVHEVLKLNDPVRESILRKDPAMLIKRVAMSTGMKTLRQSAINKMVQGLTPAVEVSKGTAPDSEAGDSRKTSAA